MAAEFIRVWLTFSLMIIAAAVLAAIWAARAGHFRNQERARKLALWAEVEERPDDRGRRAEDSRRSDNGQRTTDGIANVPSRRTA